MKKYTARYTREGSEWVVLFDQVELSTYARTLAAARKHARQALALHLDTTADRLDQIATITDVITGDGEVAAQALAAREKADQAARAATEQTKAAVARLRSAGWSLADVAAVLGITPQAVSKLDRERRDHPTPIAA
jgi:DNA-directed RNA polymerase specialized sigma24 family protein